MALSDWRSRIADHKMTPGIRVVAAVNEPYLRLLDIWIAQSGQFLPQQIDIVCMDKVSAEHCRQHYPDQIKPLQMSISDPRDRHSFWNARLACFAKLISDGENFLHTDLDAFWLKSPFPTLEKIDADLIFSMDMGIPGNVRQAWGFTLCCGFFQAKSSDASRRFFPAWQKRAKELGDDQVAANEILFAQGVTWKSCDSQIEGMRVGECQFEGKTLRLVALPLSHIPRHVPFYEQDALVVHPWFECSLFHCYLELLEYTLAHYGRLNPKANEAQLKQELDFPESLDECSAGTWRMASLALGDEPDNTRFLTLRGAMYMRLGENAHALSDFLCAKQLGDTSSVLCIWLSQAIMKNGKKSEACALLYPIASDRTIELPTIRQAAQIIYQSAGPLKASIFLLRALKEFGLVRTLTIINAWLARKLAS